jgi:hypothetical protein
MKNLFEVVKANKKNIVRGALLLGGTIVTAFIAGAALKADEAEYEMFDDVDEPEVNEVEVETTEE